MISEKVIRDILLAVQNRTLCPDKAWEQLGSSGYLDLAHTRFDTRRVTRTGLPEVIFAVGKTPDQVCEIFTRLHAQTNVLATRVSPDMAAAVLNACPYLHHNALAHTLRSTCQEIKPQLQEVAIVTAGTSDLPVAEEAKETCTFLGLPTRLYPDVGVAGLHRLWDVLDDICQATVIIVVAGMEGALPSVLGGLVKQPVIAVPTSVGYGAALSGWSALLGMLGSCVSGISVVNIDNGYGAACAASRICNLLEPQEPGS